MRAGIYEGLRLAAVSVCRAAAKAGSGAEIRDRRYSYLIYYLADETAGEIVVLNVKHPARGREYEDR